MEHLFVYGSLRPGESHAYLLERIGGVWRPASIRGTLYPDGFESTEAYPALVLDRPGNLVEGYLFSTQSLANYWPELDAYEGDGYRRVQVEVSLVDGDAVQAFVYVLNSNR